MNYVITGAAGRISSPLTRQLISNGHAVTVIGRSAEHLETVVAAGARSAIGTVTDRAFVEKAFEGAEAVYTMFPPVVHTEGLGPVYRQIAENYAAAIIRNRIPRVVNLSSVGAHLREGAGHIGALNRAEEILNGTDASVCHVRPVYFYTNFFMFEALIRSAGIMGSNFEIGPGRFPLVDPADIAMVVRDELMRHDYPQRHIVYAASDESGTDEVAAVLGAAVGRPEMRWVVFSDDQVRSGLLQSGFTPRMADEFVAGFKALGTEKFWADYWLHRPQQLGRTRLRDFARLFADVLNAGAPTA